MTRSILSPSNYSRWTKSQLIEQLQKLQRRIDESDRAESASGDEIAVLDESAARLVEIQRIAQIGYWERDLSTKEMRYSAEACSILGYDVETRCDRPRMNWNSGSKSAPKNCVRARNGSARSSTTLRPARP